MCDNWKPAETSGTLTCVKIFYAQFPNQWTKSRLSEGCATTDSFTLPSKISTFFVKCFAPKSTSLEVVCVSFQVELENKRLHGHFAPVFGFMCGLLKLSLVQTQQLFLFSTLRTVIASAVRLGNIGPLQVTDVISFSYEVVLEPAVVVLASA